MGERGRHGVAMCFFIPGGPLTTPRALSHGGSLVNRAGELDLNSGLWSTQRSTRGLPPALPPPPTPHICDPAAPKALE